MAAEHSPVGEVIRWMSNVVSQMVGMVAPVVVWPPSFLRPTVR